MMYYGEEWRVFFYSAGPHDFFNTCLGSTYATCKNINFLVCFCLWLSWEKFKDVVVASIVTQHNNVTPTSPLQSCCLCICQVVISLKNVTPKDFSESTNERHLDTHTYSRSENSNCCCCCFCHHCCSLLLMKAFHLKMRRTIWCLLCRTTFRKLKLLTPWSMCYLLPRQELGKMENNFSNLNSFTVGPPAFGKKKKKKMLQTTGSENRQI